MKKLLALLVLLAAPAFAQINIGNGGAVTATLVTLNTLVGATFVVTNTGYGATAAPTTATVSSGTATCSGTATLVTVLGGAQGNAVMIRSMKTTQ